MRPRLAAGCVVQPIGGRGDDDDASDDDLADDDVAGDDDVTGDDDVADDDASDDDATGDDDTVPAPEDVHGNVYVAWSTGDYGVPYEAYGASATFYDRVDWEPASVEEIDPQEGIDDCGLTRTDMSSSSGEYVYRSAGDITIRSGSQEVVLSPQASGGMVYYGADLGDLGLQPRWGETYAISVEGDEIPGFSLDPGLVFPHELTVTSPDLSYQAPLARGDVRFRWTGEASAEPVAIGISGYDPSGTFYQSVWCRVADDGDFTVPGSLVEQLAAGEASVWVQRGPVEYVDLGGGYYVIVGVVATVSGLVILE